MREHSSRVVSRLVKTQFFLLDSFKVLVTINSLKRVRAHWIVGPPFVDLKSLATICDVCVGDCAWQT